MSTALPPFDQTKPLRRPSSEVRQIPESERNPNDPEHLKRLGAEKMPGDYGSSFDRFDGAYHAWVASLPGSDLPLLDVGAGYGYKVIRALKAGRDVIAVDAVEGHVRKIEERVNDMIQTVTAADTHDSVEKLGKLVDTKVAAIPNSDLFAPNSVAGILMTEVAYLLKPGDLNVAFQHFFKWLHPGGIVAVTSVSPAAIHLILSAGATLSHNRSVDQMWEFLEHASDDDILADKPGMISMPKDVHWKGVRSVYVYSLQELLAVSRKNGFDVLHLDYFSPKMYPHRNQKCDECSMLIVQKPL